MLLFIDILLMLSAQWLRWFFYIDSRRNRYKREKKEFHLMDALEDTSGLIFSSIVSAFVFYLALPELLEYYNMLHYWNRLAIFTTSMIAVDVTRFMYNVTPEIMQLLKVKILNKISNYGTKKQQSEESIGDEINSDESITNE